MTKLTTENLGKKYRLFINGKLFMTSMVHDVITSRVGEISMESPEQALSIAKRLIGKP